MDDDTDAPGGDPLSGDRALVPATDEKTLHDPANENAGSRHDDAGRATRRRHGADAAARDKPGRRVPRTLQKRIDELVRDRIAAAHERDLWRDRALSAAADGAGAADSGLPAGGQPVQREPVYDKPAESSNAARTRHPADADPAGPDLTAFAARVAEARARLPDFDRVAFDPALPVSAAMAETIARSDRGPDIAYQLGRSPALARRIAGLDNLSAARELGRIEAALAPVPARRVTGAPPPVRILDGAESPRRDPNAMGYDEYRRWRATR